MVCYSGYAGHCGLIGLFGLWFCLFDRLVTARVYYGYATAKDPVDAEAYCMANHGTHLATIESVTDDADVFAVI